MKAIIKKTIEEFDNLNERIHLSLQENIPGYSGVKWSDPINNVTTNEIACIIETEGLRGAIILGFVLTNEEKNLIVEISHDDENWFPKRELGMLTEGV